MSRPITALREPAYERLHSAACDRGEPAYNDPETGLFVLTATFLRNRGYCCRRGCRHCPFHASEHEAATATTARRGLRRTS